MVLLASTYDESRFFKAVDLAVEKKLKIKSVTEELIGMGKDQERKLVVWFTNDKHGLVLNRTNNRILRGAFGDAVDGWSGKIIILFPTMAEFRGKMGPAMRVRLPEPKPPASAPVSAPRSSPSGNSAAMSSLAEDAEFEAYIEKSTAEVHAADDPDDEGIPF